MEGWQVLGLKSWLYLIVKDPTDSRSPRAPRIGEVVVGEPLSASLRRTSPPSSVLSSPSAFVQLAPSLTQELIDAPDGPPLTIGQAAAILHLPEERVAQLTRLGAMTGCVVDDQLLVSRRSVVRRLPVKDGRSRLR